MVPDAPFLSPSLTPQPLALRGSCFGWLVVVTVVFLSLFSFQAQAASPQISAVDEIKKHLLVVYNENAADSRELAFAYAAARNLDRSQLLAIRCPEDEEITREVFDSQIRLPIRKYMLENNLLKLQTARVNFGHSVKKVTVAQRNDVWSMVLIRGIPLKIKHDPTHLAPTEMPTQFQKNEAAVDSELTLIMYDPMELAGFIPNPYYSNTDLRPFTKEMALSLVLVARLDAPTSSDVRRMIRDAVATEALELTGRSYFDARGITSDASGYKIGDDWIRNAAADSRRAGMEVVLDNQPDLLSPKLPAEDIALYAGWYAGDLEGPFNRPDFKFRPGAVAYHLHSFSASTIHSTTKRWVGPLISQGATATMGSVYEPYLRFTPNVRTFFRSLLAGQCFAEAAYQSQSALSWMITMVGDPLYRPFPRTPIESAQLAQSSSANEAPWLCLRIARLITQKSMPLEEKIQRITRMVNALPHAITYEGLGDILIELKAPDEQVIAAFRQAENLSSTTVGKIRIGLKIASQYASQNDIRQTMAEYEHLLAQYPAAARAFDVPDKALAYATQNGWQQFSPELESFLAPVGENPKDNGTTAATTPTSAPATTAPLKPRKDLIPKKPQLAPPRTKSGQQSKPLQHHNPNFLPVPGS